HADASQRERAMGTLLAALVLPSRSRAAYFRRRGISGPRSAAFWLLAQFAEERSMEEVRDAYLSATKTPPRVVATAELSPNFSDQTGAKKASWRRAPPRSE